MVQPSVWRCRMVSVLAPLQQQAAAQLVGLGVGAALRGPALAALPAPLDADHLATRPYQLPRRLVGPALLVPPGSCAVAACGPRRYRVYAPGSYQRCDLPSAALVQWVDLRRQYLEVRANTAPPTTATAVESWTVALEVCEPISIVRQAAPLRAVRAATTQVLARQLGVDAAQGRLTPVDHAALLGELCQAVAALGVWIPQVWMTGERANTIALAAAPSTIGDELPPYLRQLVARPPAT